MSTDEQPETLPARVTRLRTGAGLSMRGLADKAGISIGTVSALEAGKVPSPTIIMLVKLSYALDAPVPALLGHPVSTTPALDGGALVCSVPWLTDRKIETSFELFGGPTCLAEIAARLP